jgi:hypothetical protein
VRASEFALKKKETSMSDMIEDILKTKYVVLSKGGPHAREDEMTMFRRKQGEIHNSKQQWSFWYYRSWPAKPDRPWTATPKAMQEFCRKALVTQGGVYCVFYGGGGPPPATNDEATHFFRNDPRLAGRPEPIPKGITPTGKMDRGAYAMVFAELVDVHDQRRSLSLWDYSHYAHPGKAVRNGQGNSTHLCEKIPSDSDTRRVKAYRRKVVGIGRLTEPFAVWLACEQD